MVASTDFICSLDSDIFADFQIIVLINEMVYTPHRSRGLTTSSAKAWIWQSKPIRKQYMSVSHLLDHYTIFKLFRFQMEDTLRICALVLFCPVEHGAFI